MKRLVLIAFSLLMLSPLAEAQKKDIRKEGLNLGPLPVVAYDADKGFQLGAIIQLFDYGDGTFYPNYKSKWFVEASFFTKGSMLFQLMYDNKTLIPGVRWSSAVTLALDKGMDFFGFNGYQSYYDYGRMADGSQFSFSPFYRVKRNSVLAKSDFVGKITDHLKWEAGYHASYFDESSINYDNINKGKSESKRFPKEGEPGYVGTLYENFLDWGLISPEEAEGGFTSSVRLGLTYDTRDKEGAPSRGIWAEGHFIGAPKWLGTKNDYARYSLTWRHYLPVVKNDVLTFAYRLNYEGTIGKNAPYYVLPYITVMGENGDKDGMGGFRNVRGIVRNRVVGLDMLTYTAELRWRFMKFHVGRQNIALALNLFSDGSTVTRGRDLSFKGDESKRSAYDEYFAKGRDHDTLHSTIGAGFRFIMNENFIVAAEYGTPFSHLFKNSPVYNQDGTGAFYVNVGYLF